MSKFARNLPRKFISFRHLGVKSSAHKMLENPRIVAKMREANTVKIGETFTSPVKDAISLQDASMTVESIGARLQDRNLTMAQNDCVLTSSHDDLEVLSAFGTERLQCLGEGSVEKLIGDESVNVEEILCGDVGVKEVGDDKRQSVGLNVKIGGDVDVDDRRFSPDVEINRILREELGSATVTSTPKRAAWPMYTKRSSSVLSEQEGPLCKAVMFDVASRSGTFGGAGLSKGNDTNTSEGLSESFVTSGGFSALEGFAQRQAD